MFLIHWVSSLVTFIIILALYLVVIYRKPDVNWGSTTQAQTYKSALTSTYRLQQIDEHVKNYRPQVLVLAGTLQCRPPLVDLANQITKHNSLMIVGDVVTVSISSICDPSLVCARLHINGVMRSVTIHHFALLSENHIL